jgi:hypothetical protein
MTLISPTTNQWLRGFSQNLSTPFQCRPLCKRLRGRLRQWRAVSMGQPQGATIFTEADMIHFEPDMLLNNRRCGLCRSRSRRRPPRDHVHRSPVFCAAGLPRYQHGGQRASASVGALFAEACWFVLILDSRFREVGTEVTSSQPSCFTSPRCSLLS